MDYRQLGRTDLNVSTITFGCWAMGGHMWGEVDDTNSIAAVRRALELGINFYDTADIYGFGHSEEVLAEALGSRRDEVLIATKGTVRHEEPRGFWNDSSRAWLLQACDDSLRRLKTDRIDLYQLHWPDADTPIEESMGALRELIDAGKIRYAGVSNYNVQQMTECLKHLDIVSLQPPYSLVQRQVEQEILPFCLEHHLGVLAYSPMYRGLLTGKFTAEATFGEDDLRAHDGNFQGEQLRKNLARVEKLKAMAAEYGKTVAQLALAWVLSHPAMTVALCGAKKPSQIEESAGAAGWTLTPDERARVEELWASV